MNPLLSYIRHLVVLAVLYVVEQWKLPIDGAADAANVIGLLVIGTLTWLFTKYGTYIASRFKGGANLFLLAIALAGLFTLNSCNGIIESYTVNGEGLDWEKKPIQRVSPDRVTPNVNIPLPDELGGGHVTVPARVVGQK